MTPAPPSEPSPTGPPPNAADRRVNLLAKLFDLRSFIGSLFTVFGIIVTVDGLVADQAEIDKAAGINLSLWTGLAMLVLAAVFLVWVVASPPQVYRHREFTEDDVPERLRARRPEH
jgi:hypothetical protein